MQCPLLHLMANRQLAEVRKGFKDKSGGARVVEAEKKLIICAVKKPLKLSESVDGESRVNGEFCSYHFPIFGLIAGLPGPLP